MPAGLSRRALRRVARVLGEPAWYFTRRFHPPGAVSFVKLDDESFWCEWRTNSGVHTWVHGVWSLTAYGRHVAVEKMYLQRFGVRSRSRFPFIRVRQRVRPTPGHRRRIDGSIEADFVLGGPTEAGSRLYATIVVVDQLNRRYRMHHEFAWRGIEAVARHADPILNLTQPVGVSD